jgi:thiamine-phosphate pyrophosphorylase
LRAFRFPCEIYPIVDNTGVSGRSHVELTRAVLAAGVRFLQLRVKDKSAREFVEIARAVKAETDRAGARLIVNDRVDVARLVDAAGVHLGQDDLPPEAAREQLGPGKIIGFSTHNLAQIEAAPADAIDYVGFGPIFATGSKANPDPVQGLDGLRAVRSRCRLPLVAIGGIGPATCRAVLDHGADAAAVIGAVCRAGDPGAAVRELLGAAGRGTG